MVRCRCAFNIAEARDEGLSSSQAKWGGLPSSFSPSSFLAARSQVTAVLYLSWLEHRQPDPAKGERLQIPIVHLGPSRALGKLTNCLDIALAQDKLLKA